MARTRNSRKRSGSKTGRFFRKIKSGSKTAYRYAKTAYKYGRKYYPYARAAYRYGSKYLRYY